MNHNLDILTVNTQNPTLGKNAHGQFKTSLDILTLRKDSSHIEIPLDATALRNAACYLEYFWYSPALNLFHWILMCFSLKMVTWMWKDVITRTMMNELMKCILYVDGKWVILNDCTKSEREAKSMTFDTLSRQLLCSKINYLIVFCGRSVNWPVNIFNLPIRFQSSA